MPIRFTSVKFRNYKTFKTYSISLAEFNILVGPNNAGKSTVIGAFRILAEGIKRAQAKASEFIGGETRAWGYPVHLQDLPVSTENVFTNYDEAEPATVTFDTSSGNKLKLVFLGHETCFLVPETDGRPIRTPTDFKRAFDLSVSFVPVLGPVEHDEPLNQRETARRALLTHRASRNFRNIWYHFQDGFDEFRALITETWPGMDIQMPELTHSGKSAKLHMFCPEDRMSRELYWAGFGFQVWCQMLTFITKASAESLLIIDEPDIYLHSDLQRQLVHLLRSRNGDTLIATHSTEILAEAESGEIVVLSKKGVAGQRIRNPSQLQSIFGALGSNLNPILTQLAKTKRILFVEGEDFTLLSAFARKLGMNSIANRSSFAVVGARGFNPSRVADFSEGIEATLGVRVQRGVIFDRDYRSDDAADSLTVELAKSCSFVRIHRRKELENFLLVPSAIARAARQRVADRRSRGAHVREFDADVEAKLVELTEEMKADVLGQYMAHRVRMIRESSKGTDESTASTIVYSEFEQRWGALDDRLKLVPGKSLIARVNDWLQKEFGISLTIASVVSSMQVSEIPDEMKTLMAELSSFAAG